MSARVRLGTALLAASLLAGAGARAATHTGEVMRLALVVGANRGAGADKLLRFAETDAARFAGVLREIGRHRSRDVLLLRNPNPRRLLATLNHLRQRVRRLRQRRRKVVFTFYYSGHANPFELRMRGGTLPLPQLRARLRRIAADVRLVVLDACHAGAYQALARKGGRPAPSFRIRMLDDLDAKGEVIIASSAPNEEAQESEALRGSFFTSHFISGLRGAADRDRNAQVTLGEAYGYAYAQTLRSTALSHAGLQHPRYQYDVTGNRDLVLAWPAGAEASLTVRARTAGPFLVFSSSGEVLYAEVPSRAGRSRAIGLPQGAYLVHKRTTGGLLQAKLTLARGQRAVLDERLMDLTTYEPTVSRGGFGAVRLVGGARSFVGLGLDFRLSPVLGLSFGGGYAESARAFGFDVRNQAGVEMAVGFDRARWWSLYLGVGYHGASAKRRLDTLALSTTRVFVDGRFQVLSTPRFRLGIGGGVGLYRAAARLGDLDQVGWTGGARAGLLFTVYLWNGLGLGFGYHYVFVNDLVRDALGRTLEVGGHQLTLFSLSLRL